MDWQEIASGECESCLVGDRRLRHPERLGRRGERAQLSGGAEAADLLERQKLCF